MGKAAQSVSRDDRRARIGYHTAGQSLCQVLMGLHFCVTTVLSPMIASTLDIFVAKLYFVSHTFFRLMPVRVKICCIANVGEARLAIRYGASAIGLVSAMPSGPGVIPEDSIPEIAANVPPGVATFLLTSRTDVAEIIAQQRRCRTNTIQICDRLVVGTHQELREALPGIAIVQVVHVGGEQSVDEAMAISQQVDALLLDSGNQDTAIKELGGTGRVHDWRLSRRIVESSSAPVFLAGGLNSANVSEAIQAVGPYGVDVCSGLRVEGRLEEEKVRRFFDAVRKAETMA